MTSLTKPTPWDSAVFGMPTWELTEYSDLALHNATLNSGHYTIKVNPLANKKLLHDYGFYYCDTLIEPHCRLAKFRPIQHPDASISTIIDPEAVMTICNKAFIHGRFHRDFNLPHAAADIRYDNWLKQLLEAQKVFGLYWQGRLAGFVGHESHNLVLHAIAEPYRGRGLSKYWWSAVCGELFSAGHSEISSSISASNLAVLNLYASLGFTFTQPQDVYHRLII